MTTYTEALTSAQKLDSDMRDFIEQVAEKNQNGCAFWACEGPDEKPVGMKTCHHCWTIWDARQLMKRIDPNWSPA